MAAEGDPLIPHHVHLRQQAIDRAHEARHLANGLPDVPQEIQDYGGLQQARQKAQQLKEKAQALAQSAQQLTRKLHPQELQAHQLLRWQACARADEAQHLANRLLEVPQNIQGYDELPQAHQRAQDLTDKAQQLAQCAEQLARKLHPTQAWRTTIAIILLCFGIGIFLVFLARLALYIAYNKYKINDNITNCTSIGLHSDSRYGKNFSDFSYALYLFITGLHLLEVAFITFGIQYYYYQKRENGENLQLDGWCSHRLNKTHTCLSRFAIFIVIITMIVYGLLALVPPALGFVITPNLCLTELGKSLAYAHTVTTLLDHIFAIIIRSLMICSTVRVVNIWNEALNPEEGDGIRAINYNHLRIYTDRENRAVPIYNIYRSWYVIQWFLYVLEVCLDGAYIFQQVESGKKQGGLLYGYYGAYIAYAALSLIIPFVCGMEMNSHVREFIERLQESQEQTAVNADNNVNKDINASMFMNELRIVKRPKSEFEPRIPGTGTAIPLDSPGFIITLLFTLFAFWGRILAF